MQGVILYGPPAAGKDTVTVALQSLNPAYELYRRIKVGPGRTEGYRIASSAELETLRRAGEIIWENERYGATYLVTRSSLHGLLDAGSVPIVHLGQVPAVDAVRTATSDVRWLVVYLWCPRDVAAERLVQRGSADAEARLRAWDDTAGLRSADIRIDTSVRTPNEVAEHVDAALGPVTHSP